VKRLVLFDIDETILSSDGSGRRAITRALNEYFKCEFDSRGVSMSGKTDPQICHEILALGGLSIEAIEAGLPKVLENYLAYLQEEVDKSAGYRLHPGVRELIDVLDSRNDVFLGLLTGNVEPGARIKLGKFDLNGYFKVGAYGSDSADRMRLPEVAMRRATQYFAADFAPGDLVIIGDSIHDIRCARGFGAKAIGVNTGLTKHEDLAAEQPEFLFPSLADTDAVVEAVFT
jgi:phosphoglycolate phosphatase